MPSAPKITTVVEVKAEGAVRDLDRVRKGYAANNREVQKLRREEAKQAKAARIAAAQRKKQIAALKSYGKAAAVAAAAVVGREVIRNTYEFEKQMNRVAAVSGATGTNLENLAAQAQMLGASTKFAASEVAAGQAFLAQAGFRANEIISAMPGLLDLAAAGMLDLANASDIASNIMGAFNIKAADTTDVADVLAATAASSNTSIEQLGEAMSYVGPVAASAGLSLRDVAAAVGILGNSGIQASRAGTGLNTILSKLLNPSAKANAVFKQLGITLRDGNGELRNWIDILGEMLAKGAATEDFFAVFEQRGAPAALILAKNAAAAKSYREELDDTEGAVKKMANVMETGLVGAIHNLKSAWEGLTISMGKSPLLSALVIKPIEGLTELIRALTPEAQVLGNTVESLGAKYAETTDQIAKLERQLAELEDEPGRRAQNQRATLRRRIADLKEENQATNTLAGLKLRIAEIDEQVTNPTYRKSIQRLRREKAELEKQVAEIEGRCLQSAGRCSGQHRRAVRTATDDRIRPATASATGAGSGGIRAARMAGILARHQGASHDIQRERAKGLGSARWIRAAGVWHEGAKAGGEHRCGDQPDGPSPRQGPSSHRRIRRPRRAGSTRIHGQGRQLGEKARQVIRSAGHDRI